MVDELEAFLTIGRTEFELCRVLVKKEYKKINVVLEINRDQVIGMFPLFAVENFLAPVQSQHDDLLVGPPALVIKVEDRLRSGTKACQDKASNDQRATDGSRKRLPKSGHPPGV